MHLNRTAGEVGVIAGLWSALFGVLVLLGLLGYWMFEFYADYSLKEDVSSLSEFVNEVRSACASVDESANEERSLSRWIAGDGLPPAQVCNESLADAERCIESVESVTGKIGPQNEFAKQEREQILRLPACNFEAPSVARSLSHSEDKMRSALVVVVLSSFFVTTASAFSVWVLGYPSVGWRRLSLMLSPFVGLVLFLGMVTLGENDYPISIGVAAICSIASIPIVLMCRELFLWVIDGFGSDEGKFK